MDVDQRPAVRARRRNHPDRSDATDRSGHSPISDRNQGAPQRVAAQCVQRVDDGRICGGRARAIDAAERDGSAAMKPNTSERGIAIVLALFLMSALSVIAASLMFLSQTETYASMNYKLMSQARYGAEAGVEKAANFLFDTAQYAKPGTVVADPLTNFDYSGSPVTYNAQPVVLSAMTGISSNYP